MLIEQQKKKTISQWSWLNNFCKFYNNQTVFYLWKENYAVLFYIWSHVISISVPCICAIASLFVLIFFPTVYLSLLMFEMYIS